MMVDNKEKKRFHLKKALFILPNAFTLASIFCGVYAILHTLSHNTPESLYRASIAVFFAGFFDMFDGRIARLTKTQSDFGMEFDSLADLVNFGVAPSVIVYRWALTDIGPLGIFASICYVACGAIRLARFNVLAKKPSTGKDFFVGLPIPVAASMIVAMVIAHFRLFAGMPVTRELSIVFLMLFLGFLMVSTVEFWSFKEIKMGRYTIYALFIIALGFFIAGLKYPVSLILVSLLGTYILSGSIRYIWLAIYQKRDV